METKFISLQNFTPMKGDIQSNPIHHSIKTVELGRKKLKGIPNRVVFMATSTFKNMNVEFKKCLLLWSTFLNGSKYMLIKIAQILV